DAEDQLEKLLPEFRSSLLKSVIVNGETLTADQWRLLDEGTAAIRQSSATFQILVRGFGRHLPDPEWIRSLIRGKGEADSAMFYLPLPLDDTYLLVCIWTNESLAHAALDRLELMSDLVFGGPDWEDSEAVALFTPVHSLEDSGDVYVSLLGRLNQLRQSPNERIFLSGAWERDLHAPNRMVVHARTYIEKHLTEEFPLQNVAAHLKIHPGYLSKLFKDSEGMNLQNYIISRKMELAARKLKEPGAKVYEVAEQVGYGSPYHFSRMFKKIKGVTPKDYQTHGR
ncbi:MAG: helix-turn-helix transcriptional regulator, partial [Spirochaetaceae bacterium]|nr:helix-turn-helix transcriptional regulator [Spirochaetaceae bacterium]